MSRTRASVSDRYLGEKGRRYVEWQSSGGILQGRLNLFKFAPHVSSSDTVLDFGCGDGSLLSLLPAARRIGIEPNPHARAAAAEKGLEVAATPADLADDSIDVAVSNHALEHVLDPYGALVELRRILRPGGRLVICVPAEDWRWMRRWQPGDWNHHLFAWTPRTLGNLLEEAGFEIERVEILTHAWPPYYPALFRHLPRPGFDAVCRTWSVVRRSRQVLAVAHA